MPRKATTKVPADPKEAVDAQALQEATAVFDENNKRLALIDSQFGDGLPYDFGRLIHETQFYLQQSAEAMLEAGKRLIMLKEHEPQGEFQNALTLIGLAPRAAQKMMQAAVKYTGPKSKLASLGKTKLLELMVEDDEELEQLAEGGTLAGMTLDEIDRMTKAELREHLRKEKEKREQDNDVHEKLLTQKDAKINELDKQLHGGRNLPSWPELVSETQIQTQTAAFQAMEACDKLAVLREQILTGDLGDLQGEDAEPAIESMAVTYYNALYQLWGQVGQLMTDAEEVFVGYKMQADERAANAVSDPE
ncbi:DUF3102 domain-containing protein [Sedimenticola selenatireducens]|uniref:DUF3102 domain-containing protein n=1 Tax=Sedimenticola selenatireducens TaxID=191960 RepID=A0A557S0D6_9GAMM|nr:DUF3102 domain-containing protein [Sedimenticola selenatireducens]TVO70874.1 DUF3102 domain-containing protein [Sedimenticola selenatireducens]